MSKPYIRSQALPDWWDAELDQDPVATLEGAAYISSRLGLSLYSLLDPSHPITFAPVGTTKFKKRQETQEHHLSIAQSMATHIADLVTYACKPEYTPPPTSPHQIRQSILATHSTVSLEGLLKFCWYHGIPVIHFSQKLPQGIRKMDGMVTHLNNHPVIVLCNNKKLSAWQLFNLAHELGHILCGHVNDGILVDEDISKAEQDIEEQEANRWAAELLGTANLMWPNRLNSQDLKEYAQRAQIELHIDPSAVCLNYAWLQDDWRTGQSVANQFDPSANAPNGVLTYKRGEIWWVDLQPVVGHETDKQLPCLILQNDIGNQNSLTTIVAPFLGGRRTIRLLLM